jgi:hypothetical protein
MPLAFQLKNGNYIAEVNVKTIKIFKGYMRLA